MPHLTLPHKAIVWKFTGEVDSNNEPIVSNPEPINVFWTTKRIESVNPNGTPLALEGMVLVDTYVPVRSIIAKGDMSLWGDVQSGQDTSQIGELMQVEVHNESTDLRGMDDYLILGIKRFRNSLPTIQE